VPRARALAAAALAAATLAGGAQAAGGSYAFDGGTALQRGEVRDALAASSFDWDVVPATVVIHIAPGYPTRSVRGHVWLDADLLDAGTFSWGLVQHEYAHQVDFFLFDDVVRQRLTRLLRAGDWCYEQAGLPHEAHGCERFASTLAWAYWPVRDNALRPQGRNDESAALPPAAFRRLLAELLA
jgi:hypothetical protein